MDNKLKEYVDNFIYKHYSLNDKGHDMNHVKYVINRSMEFAKQVEGINLDMVYVIAAFHDVGHHIDAKNHEMVSAEILYNDEVLKRYFSLEKMKIMKEAIEDHRSSLEGEPRSIYGKIVSSADRNTDLNTTLKRCFSYNSRHNPDLSIDEIIEICRLFLIDKYGTNGYVRDKMYFKDLEFNKLLDDITNLTKDKEEFYNKIKSVNNV